MYAKATTGLQRLLRVYWVVHNFLRVHFTIREVPAVALGILIGKYLSSLRKLEHVIAPKEGFETQL